MPLYRQPVVRNANSNAGKKLLRAVYGQFIPDSLLIPAGAGGHPLPLHAVKGLRKALCAVAVPPKMHTGAESGGLGANKHIRPRLGDKIGVGARSPCRI